MLARGARDQAIASRVVDEALAAASGLVVAYLAGALSPGADVEAVAVRATADVARALAPRLRPAPPDRAATDAVVPVPADDQPSLF